MASTCPNCGKKLKWYNMKAECSECGVSIPNYNWEGRLEEDAQRSEKKFVSFYKTMNMLAYSIWGTKLRRLRIILSFLPAIGYILPWGYLKSDGESIGLDVIGLFTEGKSLINVFADFFANKGLYFTNMAYEGNSGILTFSMLSILFMVLSLVFIVIAFFLILFTFKHPKTKSMVVFDALSIASAIASAVVFSIGLGNTSSQTAVNFGTFSLYNISGGISWGIFVAIALLVVAFVANLLVAKAPAKSDEELEEERLAKKAEKEEKERQADIKKEKEREEAEKKAAEEQKRAVEEAKAKLEAKKNKKKKD
ncbi:MAG: hypothetical protein E7570_07390 [Ruminococcaceae bacterium]|nr:hypothetical protein [Oscillospiraceae bacterium]